MPPNKHLNGIPATQRPPVDEEHKLPFDEIPCCVPPYKSSNLNSITNDSDLGSLYAQKRSKTVTLRSGGEGKQLPRYVEYQIENQGQGRSLNDTNVTTVAVTDSSGIKKSKCTTPASIAPIKSTSAVTTFFSRIRLPTTSPKLIAKPNLKNLSSTGVVHKSKDDVMAIHLPANSAPTVKIVVPPDNMMKLVREAVKEWNMIEEGDHLLLGKLHFLPLSSLLLSHVFFPFQVSPEGRILLPFSIFCLPYRYSIKLTVYLE